MDQAAIILSLQVFRHGIEENSKSESQLKIDMAYYYWVLILCVIDFFLEFWVIMEEHLHIPNQEI